MEKYAECESILNNFKEFNVIITIIIAFVLIILFFVSLKYLNRKYAISVALIGIAMCLCMYIFEIRPFSKDIEEKAYTIYDGEFQIEDYHPMNKTTYIYILFPDKDEQIRYETSPKPFDFDIGKSYNDKLVIAENSDVLLEIVIENSTWHIYK